MILYGELKALVAALNAANVPYALCGGLAMAVHGSPRATVDIDLLILPPDVERTLAVAEKLGFKFAAQPMEFGDGAVRIRRVSKMGGEDEDPVVLDLILVTGPLQPLWEHRQQIVWESCPLHVLSRDAMIQMKSLRGSHQDRADISRLREPDEG
ncbi:MAG: nucleotidyl transferase AbiEii/AbiGii toxin family protein [Terriglobales bacterium]